MSKWNVEKELKELIWNKVYWNVLKCIVVWKSVEKALNWIKVYYHENYYCRGCTGQKGVCPENRFVGPNRLKPNAKCNCCVQRGGVNKKQWCKQQNSGLKALRANQNCKGRREKSATLSYSRIWTLLLPCFHHFAPSPEAEELSGSIKL